MKQSLQNMFRNQAFKTRRLVGLEKSLVLSGEIRAEQIASRAKLTRLSDAEFSVFSQWGEDGIIAWLVEKLRPANTTFVEFGVQDFRESNARFLLMSRNWSGLVIDGSQAYIDAIRSDDIAYKHDLQTTCAFITRDNIQGLIAAADFGPRIGILSVDLDGNDYWILEAIDTEADIVIVEYNDLFGGRPSSVPYKSDFVRLAAHPSGMYWGASLPAFRHLLEKRGYRFAGTNLAGTNAFFVHSDHATKLERLLDTEIAHPCRMREARNPDGSLSYKTYGEMCHLVADLPLVDVTTMATIKAAQSFKTPPSHP